MESSIGEARERARAAAARVHGWLSDAQGEALFDAAARLGSAGAVVEIGSWQGRSTIWLASGARLNRRTVFAIDPHEGSREDPSARTLDLFARNLSEAGLTETVEPLVMRSGEAVAYVKAPVALLFVDGDHSIAGARRDAEIWLPRVALDGVVMFHDVATSGYSGPRRVFQRMVCWSRDFHRIRKVGSMGIAERTSARTRGAAARGLLFGALLFWYDIQAAIKHGLRGTRRLVSRSLRIVNTLL
jgi:predicted O-methyltransferase YrrM